MRMVRFAVLAIGALFFISGASRIEAKPEDSKKTGKPCVTCHVKAGSKKLNETGECYQKTRDLSKCPEKKK